MARSSVCARSRCEPCCLEGGRGFGGAGLGCGQHLLLSAALRLERGDLRVQAFDNLGGAGLGRGQSLLLVAATPTSSAATCAVRRSTVCGAASAAARPAVVGSARLEPGDLRAQLLLLEVARAKLWPDDADVVPRDAVEDEVDGGAHARRPRPRRRRAWRRRSPAVPQSRVGSCNGGRPATMRSRRRSRARCERRSTPNGGSASSPR